MDLPENPPKRGRQNYEHPIRYRRSGPPKWLFPAIIAACAVFVVMRMRTPDGEVDSPTVAKEASGGVRDLVDNATMNVPESVRSLAGKWVREDGGYVLEIREARADGTSDAAYFNPNPIRVSRTAWTERGGDLQLFVELSDTGYPGATYALKLNAAGDRLAGEYMQPATQQTYQIEFVRQP